mmetsp:Transcript_3450/g.8586  ORF Transcript_3450/g.8586 Transcript_3450/m.8586 type:complete len:400 (+) Transcript_3450:59-1258(+)
MVLREVPAHCGRMILLTLVVAAVASPIPSTEELLARSKKMVSSSSCIGHGACDTCVAVPEGAAASACFWCLQDDRCHPAGQEASCKGGSQHSITNSTRCPTAPEPASNFDLATAERMAVYSYAAYYDDPRSYGQFPSTAEVMKTFFYKMGHWNHAFGFVAMDRHRQEVILAFRGSDTLWQLMEEIIHSSLVDWPKVPGAKVNEFFNMAHMDLHENITQTFKVIQNLCLEVGGCRFFITGHSLGGAMAGLAAMRLADEFEAVQRSLQVYTFGQPRVGNAIIAHRINLLVPNYFRVVNALDVVPHIPGCTQNSSDANDTDACDKEADAYYHAGSEYWFPEGDYQYGVMCHFRTCLPMKEDMSCSDGALLDAWPRESDHHHYWDVIPNGYCQNPAQASQIVV